MYVDTRPFSFQLRRKCKYRLKFLSYVACRKFAATQKLVEKTLEGVTVFSQKEEARREKFKRRLDEQEAKFKEEQASMQQPTTQTN